MSDHPDSEAPRQEVASQSGPTAPAPTEPSGSTPAAAAPPAAAGGSPAEAPRTSAEGASGEGGSTGDVEALRQAVIDAIRTCYDPEIPVNIYEMGLVYEVDVTPDGEARVVMTLTSPMCPVAETLPFEVENKVAEVPGIRSARVEVTWDPPWDPSMMSDAARLELGMM